MNKTKKAGSKNSVPAHNLNTIKTFSKSLVMMSKKESEPICYFGKEASSNQRTKNTTCNHLFSQSYGPFWIHTTVVFCLGAVHNMLKYQANPDYNYDFEILGEGFFAMYVLGFGLPIAIGFIMKAIGKKCCKKGANCTIIQILCLYGYSVSVYIPCILLCSFNVCLLHWILLGYGAANKIYFVFKNINQGFEIPVARKLIVTVLIIVEGLLQFLIFKIRFISCADQFVPSGGQKHMLGMRNDNNFVHYRQFES